jgi:hypothetical protein
MPQYYHRMSSASSSLPPSLRLHQARATRRNLRLCAGPRVARITFGVYCSRERASRRRRCACVWPSRGSFSHTAPRRLTSTARVVLGRHAGLSQSRRHSRTRARSRRRRRRAPYSRASALLLTVSPLYLTATWSCRRLVLPRSHYLLTASRAGHA